MSHSEHLYYILTHNNERYRDLLKSYQPDGLTETKDRSQATILLASPPMAATCLGDFPKLEWLQSIYAGVDALIGSDLRKDYQLTNIKGIFGQLISEYVLGFLTSHHRHFVYYKYQQRKQQWKPCRYRSLAGETMVILGTGSIGSHLSQVAGALGIRTLGINRSGIPPKQSAFDQIFHINEINTALSQAQIVVNTLPATPETDKLINREFLSYCNQAILFNVGRGQTLDEEALIPAIEAKYIQHAYLDVFCKEPLDNDHPFWQHPNITVTPHIAAVSFPDQVAEEFAANFQRWRDGFSLHNRIDFDKGY
ncbi:D-2-hydroxyacid dehydrogenase [Vibrio quintilis]|uniref:Glyoxylate/hydroxypyruvate reductase A n=1 Tax=Vibrio quintilis TaxID=1117707 RepID=A0A1M7Z214_9VIBR|nr:D-2-hydroxyacid dehydrogenase [Vibrio quintilis]SHO59009.1 Glyoxylate/hydroxypyruvate reductase A [Vibrio quintilis]